MKQYKLCILMMIAVCSSVDVASAQASTESLLNQLRASPLDLAVVGQLERSRDERALPALQQAFDDHAAKKERQYLAISLIRLGDKDEKYFAFLAGYARIAIESNAPPVLASDEKGNAIRGVINPDFEIWAEKLGMPVKEAAAVQMYTYPEDVMLLGKAMDARAVPLFTKGLQSQNDVIVLKAAEALALLNDVPAVSLIIRQSRQRGRGVGSLLASTLASYTNPDALREIDQTLVDPEFRRRYQQDRAAILRDKTNQSDSVKPKER